MKKRQYTNPLSWVPTLYFAEGLPFIAIAILSGFMYKSMDISNTDITFWTSLVILPYSLKPIWSPFMEMFKTKKYFVVATQIIGCFLFGMLALALPAKGFFMYTIILFAIIAFNGATHDIAADGVYINTLDHENQARYIGVQGAFYNVAKILSISGLVFLAGKLELRIGITEAWMVVMGIIGGTLGLIGLYHTRILPSGGSADTVENTQEALNKFFEVVKTFFEKKYIIWGLVFIILYRFAEGQLAKIVPLFWIDEAVKGGLGLSTSDAGIVGGFGAVAFVTGSIVGGLFVAKRSLRKVLFILCIIFNVPDVVYAVLAHAQPFDYAVADIAYSFDLFSKTFEFSTTWDFIFVCGAVVIEYFGYGFGFLGVTLFMMQQIAPGKYKMAHYAFATSIMNLGFILPGMLSGWLSDELGYRYFFIWVLFATIPSFLVAWFVPFRDTTEDEKIAVESSE